LNSHTVIIPTYNDQENIGLLEEDTLNLSLGWKGIILERSAPDGLGRVDKGTRTVVFQSVPRALPSTTRTKALGRLHRAEVLISSMRGDSFLSMRDPTHKLQERRGL